MENSVLSDAAGVQKNISKMYEDYAKSIGKSTDALTQAEKAQAVYNGIMAEASMFTGSAAEMAQGYQGIQAQANASSLELSRTLGETMVPILTQINSLGLSLTQTLNSLISNNKSATVGTITFVTSLGTLVLGITAVIKIMQSYKTAVDALNISTNTLKVTMASAFAVSAILASIVAVTTAINEQKEAQRELSEAQQFHNEVVSKTIELNNENVNSIQARKKEMEDYLNMLQDYNDNETTINYAQLALDMGATGEAAEEFKKVIKECTDENIVLGSELVETSGKFKKLFKIEKDGLVTADDLNRYIKIYSDRLDNATAMQKIKTAMDTETVKKQKQEAAQLKVNANQMQEYLNVVRKGDTSTTEYQNAVKKLANTYPEAANAQGIIVDKAQDFINTEQAKADQSWNTVQQIINGNTQVISSYIRMAQEAEGNESRQQELANQIGIAYSNIIPTLTSVLNIIGAIGNQTPEQVPNITPASVSTPKRSGGGGKSSKSYENKKLDNYKKLIEYKKSLDKISLQQEIAMYKKALNEYAKTTDEKRELRTKIYELEKELQEKSLDDYTSKIEHKKALDQVSIEKEIKMYEKAYKNLAKTTEQKEELEEKLYELRKELAEKNKELMQEELEAYEENIEKQKKIRGSAYTTIQEESDIDKLIEKHNKYLDKVFKDEKLSKQKKEEIQKEELEAIKELEEKKKDIRVENTNNILSLLKDAITKQLEDEEKAQKEAIENNIKVVEEWKDARIKAINEEYDARIKTIEKELDLLNKSEEEKTRAEEDAEYERKKKRLEELVEFEHDTVTKANYQKELDKLIAEHKKTLDKRELQDKKDALNEQKELLKEKQNNEVQLIEDQANKQKEQYEKEIDNLEKFYNKKKDLAEETAKQMILNADRNQKQIINLLKSYNGTYETLGQNFGEKLVYGMSNKIADNIQNVVSKIQNTIDSNINSKIKSWTSSIDKAQSSTKQAQVQNKTITVNQTNQIVQNPEMPSETYRKLKDIDRALADRLAGVW